MTGSASPLQSWGGQPVSTFARVPLQHCQGGPEPGLLRTCKDWGLGRLQGRPAYHHSSSWTAASLPIAKPSHSGEGSPVPAPVGVVFLLLNPEPDPEEVSVNTKTVFVDTQACVCSRHHSYRCMPNVSTYMNSPYPQLPSNSASYPSPSWRPFPGLDRLGFLRNQGSGILAGAGTSTVPDSPCDLLQKLFFWAAVTNWAVGVRPAQ